MIRKTWMVAVSLLASTSALAAMYATTGGGGNGCCSLYLVNETTGQLTLVGTPNFGGVAARFHLGMPGIDFTPDGRLLVVTGTDEEIENSLARLDAANGALVQVIGELPGDMDDVRDIAIHPVTGDFFGTSYDGILYAIDKTTGEDTAIGGSIDYGPLAFGVDGTLFMANMNPQGPPSLYVVDTSDGDATPIANLQHYYIGLRMGPDGMLYGAEFGGNQQWPVPVGTYGDIYRINPANGNETFLGSNPDYIIHDIAFGEGGAAGIPSLSLWGAAALALCLAGFGIRRLFA